MGIIPTPTPEMGNEKYQVDACTVSIIVMNVVIQCFPHAGTHGPYGSRNYKTQIPSLISSHTLELGTRRTHASDKRYCQKLEQEVGGEHGHQAHTKSPKCLAPCPFLSNAPESRGPFLFQSGLYPSQT